MQNTTRQEFYAKFLEFISIENRRERNVANRQMLSVFVWCFLLPVFVMVICLFLIKFNALSPGFKKYIDWVVLLFPISYSFYILSSGMLREVPKVFRSRGISKILGHAAKEGEWRERIVEAMKKNLPASLAEWAWIRSSFMMDLRNLRHRNGYFTALAGAVFFLIMEGIDSLSSDDGKFSMERHPVLGWIELNSNDFTQYVGLALFLVLLYLSGNQSYQALLRYLNCADLVIQDLEESKKEN